MQHTFRMRKDRLCDEDGSEWIVYGVEAVDSSGTVLYRCSDIFFDGKTAADFIRQCNEKEVELSHIPDIISDVLAQQYTV